MNESEKLKDNINQIMLLGPARRGQSGVSDAEGQSRTICLSDSLNSVQIQATNANNLKLILSRNRRHTCLFSAIRRNWKRRS
ncbi:MAG: hypothetical protein MZU97_00645 [Bacillus subtilis]|nr:hypothetical protein [Bacillus subtilis]